MTDQNQTKAASDEQQSATPQFAIQRIYLKDISFETPMGVEAFLKPNKPGIHQDLNIQVNPIAEGNLEVVLLLTITAKAEGRTVFLVEIKQAGLFSVRDVEDSQLVQLANAACPQILFPYAREAIDGILMRGGFPPLMLPPINFDAVFVQAIEVARQQAKSRSESSPAVAN